MTEVCVGGPGGDDQKVVVECLPLGDYLLLLQLEIQYFFKQHFNIGMGSKYPSNRSRDFSRGEAGGRDLVEEWLEGVVVSAVNDRDLHRQPGDTASGGEASEASAYDYYPRFVVYRHPL